MITGDECGQSFLTFVSRLKENPRKTLTRKLIRPVIEPGPAAWKVTMFSLDYKGGLGPTGGLEFRCRQGAFVVGNVGIFFRVSSGYSSFPNLISSTLSSSRFPAPQFHAIYYSHSIILCHPSPHPWLGNISCVWSTNSILSYLLMGGGRGRDTHHVHLHWTWVLANIV